MAELYPEPCFELAASSEYLVVLIFIKPRSLSWPLVRHFCLKSDCFVEKDGYFAAGFKKEERSIRILMAIYDIIHTWKSVHMFINHRRTESIYTLRWFECYLKALDCEDISAFCNIIYLDEYKEIYVPSLGQHVFTNEQLKPPKIALNPRRYMFPCRRVRFVPIEHIKHPSPLRCIYQAEAIDQGYSDCPLFNMRHFLENIQ